MPVYMNGPGIIYVLYLPAGSTYTSDKTASNTRYYYKPGAAGKAMVRFMEGPRCYRAVNGMLVLHRPQVCVGRGVRCSDGVPRKNEEPVTWKAYAVTGP